MPVSQAYQGIAVTVFSGSKGERPAPKPGAIPTSLYPNIIYYYSRSKCACPVLCMAFCILRYSIAHPHGQRPTVLANDHHADSRSIPYQRVHTSSTPPVVLISNSTASIQKEVSEKTDTSLLPFFPSLVKRDITYKKSAKEKSAKE